MKHQTVVYYTFCPRGEMTAGDYKKYQREIADKMLALGFKTKFGIKFDLAYVKKGTHGKPFWAGEEKIYYNISNTSGLVVCAMSDLETGVDAERVHPIKEPVMRRCCTEAETAYIMGNSGEEQARERFFRLWTLKESFIKMIGQGMYFSMREAEFSIQDTGKMQGIFCSQPGYFVQKRQNGYWIALCTQKESEVLWRELKREDL